MKKIAIALATLILLTGFIGWNVWHAVYAPVILTPGAVELGRQQLHAQFEQSKARESEIEQQDWDSIPLLRSLIQAHQHRIDQLKDNTQAGEILAHHRDAITRLEKRIADLQTQQAARLDTQSGESAVDPSQSAAPVQNSVSPATASRPAPKMPPKSINPAHPQTAKPAPKTQSPASPRPAHPPQTH